jgi:hypothetical protein
VTAIRERLMATLTSSFECERDRAGQGIREAMAPYARFVRDEEKRLRAAEGALGRLGDDMEKVAGRIESLSRD